MNYPVIIKPDGNTFMVRFVDIPEAMTCADTYEEALEEARDALITAFEFYFEDQRQIPMPSDANGRDVISVPASVWAKVLLLNTMLNEHISQAELARRMGTRKQEMQRIINLGHNTKIDKLNKALEAMGKHLSLSVV
ncbi:antitoxin [Idiomarina piscisalsi]|uniref:Antitoxin n=2 Tax=Idiomarina piscisalsi TaxID=1096243 RepID=A0ABM6LQS1_9GAMM|nr:antitoxin [Idiomarina piscisalsi]